MPREIVRIDLSSKFPMEVGARFFSTIAYPEPKDAEERDRYFLAISRLYVHLRVKENPEFGKTLHYIVPAIFTPPWRDFVRTLKKGNKRLFCQITAATWIAMPHFRGEGLKPVEVEINGQLQSIIPTVKNMGMIAMNELGWQGKSTSIPTLKSKIWAPSRPVVHAAAAYSLWCYYAERVVPAKEQVDSFFFLACLELPSTVAAILRRAEAFRLILPEIEQFQIKEEDTIQFVGQGSPVKFGNSNSQEP